MLTVYSWLCYFESVLKRHNGGLNMDEVSRKEVIGRIEYIMSYLLSKKYNADVKIHMKKEIITNGDNNQTGNIRKK